MRKQLTGRQRAPTRPRLASRPPLRPTPTQILEALNFLHVICKLVHRNLSPQNILIAGDDNWKLSGLEFAVRFESTTISESASIMAHELGAPLVRYSGQSLGLRRQRTLVSMSGRD